MPQVILVKSTNIVKLNRRLPRELAAGFVKTAKEFQSRGLTSGTTVTFVIIDRWTVTVASVGDSRCILDTQGGAVSEENEASRTRGLKDDTTCIVVGVIPPDNSAPPSPPPKKQNRFRALLFRKWSHDSASKLSRKLSVVGIVEELFEEGSTMLAERKNILQERWRKESFALTHWGKTEITAEKK
ncbi:hypothetical protein POM88_007916 [Heracleum sosnowskyi]|uniref:PPM-type phosphatase domain-containing protein n=1 Tax=Heracleum sosnowskyi TaxID=360622 RepID=A0AAD8J7P5_9APIA|nr:hypothetical protein POM88_007916 [Heracleum sosnowskyi]